MHFSRYINHWARLRPDHLALVCDGHALTWRELALKSRQAAGVLQAIGVARGDRVGCFLDNSVEWVITFTGAILAGAVLVPLNTAFGNRELAEIERDAACAVIVAKPTSMARLTAVEEGLDPNAVYFFSRREGHAAIAFADAACSRRSFAAPDLVDTDVVAIAYTSGTTGVPKGVVMSHAGLDTMCNSLSLGFGFGADERLLILAPLAFTGGFICSIAPQLRLGATAFVETHFDAARALDLLVDAKITFFSGVPALFQRVADQSGFDKAASLWSLTNAGTGGAPVPVWLLQRYLDKGVVIRQSYGCSEAGGFVSLPTPAAAIANPGACGPPIAGLDLEVQDDEGRACPPGTVGEFCLRGPQMMVGYWNKPQLTAASYRNGWYRTGDLGFLDPDGAVTVSDRKKNMVISGGVNIYPAEVERVLGTIAGVQEVAVFGIPNRDWGEELVAVIFGPQASSLATLAETSRELLGRMKHPKRIAISPEPLPKTVTNKIARTGLPDLFAALTALDAEPVP